MRITIDAKQLEGLADKLADLTPQEIARRNVDLLNEVTLRTYDIARSRITAGVNLSDDYLRRRMRVEKATENKPVASIAASGAREDMTRLGVYPNQVRAVPKKSKRDRRRVFSPPGLGAGNKVAGLDVSVLTGSSSYFQRGFIMPLRAPGKDAGYQGFGIFARNRAGRIKQRYGLSVYQLFRFQINNEDYTAAVREDLQRTIMDGAEQRVTEILK